MQQIPKSVHTMHRKSHENKRKLNPTEVDIARLWHPRHLDMALPGLPALLLQNHPHIEEHMWHLGGARIKAGVMKYVGIMQHRSLVSVIFASMTFYDCIFLVTEVTTYLD